MRKIALITAVIAALAAAAPASGAVMLAKSCGSRCSSFSADGRKGFVSVVGNGAEWGTIQSGTIWVRDRTGRSKSRKWVHGRSLHWRYIGHDGWRVTSTRQMKVGASTRFWIKLQGSGIHVCGVFDGSGTIGGSGTYILNGRKHAWPRHSTRLRF